MEASGKDQTSKKESRFLWGRKNFSRFIEWNQQEERLTCLLEEFAFPRRPTLENLNGATGGNQFGIQVSPLRIF